MPGGDNHGDSGQTAGILFVAWGAVQGRPLELAAALGADAWCLYPPGPVRRPSAPVRYLHGAVSTGRRIRASRPRVVIVTNPPIVAGLVTWAWARSVGATLVLDSHPGSFGAQGDRVAARLQALHRWLVRRAAFCLVAAPQWADLVRSWGGDAVVVHEAPGPIASAPPERHERLRILFVGRFAPDEPVACVMEAAAHCPDYDVLFTGDPARCPPELRDTAPANVTLTGFLDPAAYEQAVVGADVVVCLTTEPGSVMRAAYEAVYARRPLIVSDWPIARALFPAALFVEHTAASVTAAFREADTRFDELTASAEAARDTQLARFEEQRRVLAQRLAGLRSPS